MKYFEIFLTNGSRKKKYVIKIIFLKKMEKRGHGHLIILNRGTLFNMEWHTRTSVYHISLQLC